MVDLNGDSFAERLRPFRLLAFETLESTNTKASEIVDTRESREPFIVFTKNQTHGRGRGSNSWLAPPGVLTATFAIPCNDRFPPQFVPLITGIAIIDTCKKLGASPVGLKWPNDVWSNGLKLAGLLCERKGEFDLIGVGMNVCNLIHELPQPLATRSTSLSDLLKHTISIEYTLTEIAIAFRNHFISHQHSLSECLQKYSDNLVLKGCRIRISDLNTSGYTTSLEGVCEGVDDECRLVIINSKGRHTFYTGHVTIMNNDSF